MNPYLDEIKSKLIADIKSSERIIRHAQEAVDFELQKIIYIKETLEKIGSVE